MDSSANRKLLTGGIFGIGRVIDIPVHLFKPDPDYV